MTGRRADRVAEAVRELIAELLMRDIKDPRIGMVTITAVELSDDLRHGRVFFSCLGDDAARDRSLKGLRSAAGFIRAQVGRRLRLRYAPEFTFLFDSTPAAADRMATLLKSVRPDGDGE